MRNLILCTSFGVALTIAVGFAPSARATCSIVARDPATGQLGVALQSHWFSVGALARWAEAGVGAVATQSLVDPSYGPLGLAVMKSGRTATQALAGLLVADPHPDIRQVAMIDAQGNVTAHSGTNCIPAAGHVIGATYAVQANLMDASTVPAAMAANRPGVRGGIGPSTCASKTTPPPSTSSLDSSRCIARTQ